MLTQEQIRETYFSVEVDSNIVEDIVFLHTIAMDGKAAPRTTVKIVSETPVTIKSNEIKAFAWDGLSEERLIQIHQGAASFRFIDEREVTSKLSITIKPEIKKWISLNCMGNVFFSADRLAFFELESEASLFKLTWC